MTDSSEVHFVSNLERIADNANLPPLPSEFLFIEVPVGLTCRRLWAAWWYRQNEQPLMKDNVWRVRGWRGAVPVMTLPGSSHENLSSHVTHSGTPKSHQVSLFMPPVFNWAMSPFGNALRVSYNTHEYPIGASKNIFLHPVEFEAGVDKFTWDLVWHHGATNSLDTYIFLACLSWPKAKA